MNDCVHFDEVTDRCGIFAIPCPSSSREVYGCYLSESERDEMIRWPK